MHWIKLVMITTDKTELISHLKNPVGHFDSLTTMPLSYDKINTRTKKCTHFPLWNSKNREMGYYNNLRRNDFRCWKFFWIPDKIQFTDKN